MNIEMVNTLPLVLHLQADALDRTMPTSDVMRKAKVVAAKLGVGSARAWIEEELSGYKRAGEDLPPYRRLRGQPKFRNPVHGWCPLVYNDREVEDLLATAYIFQPVSELERLGASESGFLHVPHPPAVNRWVANQLGFAFETSIILSPAVVAGIVDRARNLVLDWTLELEGAGVLGENLTFSSNERTAAGNVTNNYFASNIGHIGDNSGGASVTNTQSTINGGIDLVQLREFLAQLTVAEAAAPPAMRTRLAEPLDALRKEAGKAAPESSVLRQSLAALKAICEGAGGDLLAAGIIAGMRAFGV